ncbi:hypothetical protein [Agrobacterium tumefaciens]|uniref:hypothetical protein n=1 Tax=Agrobacterium tumefaciens TaxID=358 RepID=UPI00287D4EF2|nr:hypothetical protein [Agrobacterium tumefaciens]MDS7594037.1 hypothetical protein [Agrobacterium tumefaciens]
MTNIKTHGFKDPAQLREHLAELDEEYPADDTPNADLNVFRSDIEELQRDVLELRRRVDELDAPRQPHPAPEFHPWLRVFATAAATFVLGRVFSGLRLGAAGAVAVPLLATKASDRILQSVSHVMGPR